MNNGKILVQDVPNGVVIFLITLVTLIIINVILVLGALMSGFEYTAELMKFSSAVSLAYLIMSWQFYDPILAEELGVRSVLGLPLDKVSAGPVYAPLGVVTIDRLPTATVQREFPAEPQKIYLPKDDEPDTPPKDSGLVPALRITFANRPIDETEARRVFAGFYTVPHGGVGLVFNPTAVIDDDGLSNSRITAVVQHITRFRIFNPIQFIIAVPPQDETGDRLDEVARQVEDEQVIALNNILSQLTVDQATRNLPWINAVLFHKVCVHIKADENGHSDKWGIDLEGAAIKPFQFNRALNASMTKTAEAAFNAVATVRNAGAAREAAILIGQGAAQAAQDLEQATLEGRAEGLAKIARLAATPEGQTALATEVARAVADGGNAVIVGTDGMKDIIALAAAVTKIKP